MTPQEKVLLAKLAKVAKKIIYNPERMKKFMQMMGSKARALQAVHTVVAIIAQKTNVPQSLMVQLGVTVYLIMVDIAQEVTGAKASPQVVQEVISEINNSSPKGATKPPSPQPQSRGIIGQKMGVPA